MTVQKFEQGGAHGVPKAWAGVAEVRGMGARVFTSSRRTRVWKGGGKGLGRD